MIYFELNQRVKNPLLG